MEKLFNNNLILAVGHVAYFYKGYHTAITKQRSNLSES